MKTAFPVKEVLEGGRREQLERSVLFVAAPTTWRVSEEFKGGVFVCQKVEMLRRVLFELMRSVECWQKEMTIKSLKISMRIVLIFFIFLNFIFSAEKYSNFNS